MSEGQGEGNLLCVSEGPEEGNVIVQLSVVGFVLVCVSVGGCTAQLADSTEIVSVGTA